MPRPAPALESRSLTRWMRRSMTARIGASIAFVGLVLVGAYAIVIDQLVAAELRDQNELRLLAELSFLRDDLTHARDGLAAVRALIEREERQQRMHMELRAVTGAVLLRTSNFVQPPAGLSIRTFAAASLPPGTDIPALRLLRASASPATLRWALDDGRAMRMIQGVITDVPPESGLPDTVIASVSLEPTKTSEVRRAEGLRLAIALALTVAIGGGLGVLLARRVVADAKSLGHAAERIGAHALHERLTLDEFPAELEGSARAFNFMLDRLQASFERLSRFSAEVAHDLRTPIGNLLGEAQVALSKARSADEYRAVLESSVEEYERISRMIGNMLFLARSDNDQTVLSLERLPLPALLQRIVSYFELVAEDRGVLLRANVEHPQDQPPELVADDSLVVRALGNLVSNALRFAVRGSEVVIEGIADTEGRWSISVSNAGPSIPPEHLERIFERFYRISAARQESASGSGLGLAIVRSIMDLHGGTVEVLSNDAQTRFTLRFPA